MERHRKAASTLAKERTWLAEKMVAIDQLVGELETSLNEEREKVKTLSSELSRVGNYAF